MAEQRAMRIPSIVLLATLGAALVAWTLRDHAYLPRLLAERTMPVHSAGHVHGTVADLPAKFISDPWLAYPLLVLIGAPVLALSIAAAVWFVRRAVRGGVAARLVFASVVAVAAALITLLLANFTMGVAVSHTDALASSVAVLQYTFVLAIAGSMLFDLP